jgi:hypothetical protein
MIIKYIHHKISHKSLKLCLSTLPEIGGTITRVICRHVDWFSDYLSTLSFLLVVFLVPGPVVYSLAAYFSKFCRVCRSHLEVESCLFAGCNPPGPGWFRWLVGSCLFAGCQVGSVRLSLSAPPPGYIFQRV